METGYIPLYVLSRRAPYQQPELRSEASGLSTYMFQSSLLGFPNDIRKKKINEEADYFTAGAKRIWSQI
jgi:hypothetical protein